MKICALRKDGGPESHSTGFFLIEWKKAFSVVLLYFSDGSRDAYHTHAFNAVSWVLRGKLVEHPLNGKPRVYASSFRPIFTPRAMFHKVESVGETWALSLRGPWVNQWREYLPSIRRFITLTHGRKVVQ